MTQTPSRRMQRLQSIAETFEKIEVQRLAEKIQAVQAAKKKFADLERYGEEYRQDLQLKLQSGLPQTTCAQFHTFLNQLDAAAKQQCAVIQHCELAERKAKDAWLKAHHRTNSLQKMQCKLAQQEQIERDKQAMAIVDDCVAARYKR